MPSRKSSFDVVVVGGGIYGIMMALEASARGLSVALIDRDEWGGGTTSNWLRIVHGGFRYLQHLDLPRFFESIRERRWFLRTFPSLVHPLACVMPLYEQHSYAPALMKAALVVNDALSFGRNRGLARAQQIPAGRMLTKAQVLDALPFTDPDGLVGGVRWHDAIVPEPDRLLSELLRLAQSNGVEMSSRTEAVGLITDGNAVSAVEILDNSSGSKRVLRTPVVVNACGHWGPDLAKRFGAEPADYPASSWAWNVLFDIPNHSHCGGVVKARRRGAQVFVVLPWRGRTLIGTGHAAKLSGPDDLSIPQDLVRQFIDEANEAIPGLGVSESRVSQVFAGHLPAVRGTSTLTRRPYIFDHAGSGTDGLFTVWGIKYTTARSVAESVIRRIAR